MFNWDDLRFFLAVARAGRLGAAGQRLQVDSTTVGRRIAALEDGLGTRLFDKSPRGYVLTEAGNKLLAHAEAMESSSFDLFREISGEAAEPTGTVRVATAEPFGSQFLAANLGYLRRRYPGIEIELVEATRTLSLSKREADLAIILARPKSGRLVRRKLGEFKLRLYAAPAYLRERGPVKNAADLADQDLIGSVDDLIEAPEQRTLEDAVEKPNVVLRAASATAQYNAAAAGLGIALLPCYMAENARGLVPVLPDEVEVVRDLWLAAHEDLAHLARIQAVCRFMSKLILINQPTLMASDDALGELGGRSEALAPAASLR